MRVFCYNRQEGADGEIELIVTLEFHGVETLGDEDRELLRSQVSEMTAQYCSEHFYTVFDDEVEQILQLLNSGEIIGQRKVGVGGPYTGQGYKDVYCIVADADEQHPEGSWLRKNFSYHSTCGQDGMWQNRDEARLTLFHYHCYLTDYTTFDLDEAVDLPAFVEPEFDMDGSRFHSDPTPEQEASYAKWQEECQRTGADPSGIQ